MNGNQSVTAEKPDPISRAAGGKYLTFKLGAEEYAFQILKVQEIIKMMEITRVPRTPDFVRGVINLRGKVIPVVDLRLKFGMPGREATDKTCVIVVRAAHAGGSLTMGTIVDEVSEVMDIAAQQIEPTPGFGTPVNTDFILGLGKVAKKVLMLLDIDKVLSRGEVATVSRVPEVA